MTKHTPGPWMVKELSGTNGFVIYRKFEDVNGGADIEIPGGPLEKIGGLGGEICRLGKDASFSVLQTAEANAHLIASSPRMKFAIEFLLQHHDNPEAWPEILRHANEANEQAEGRA